MMDTNYTPKKVVFTDGDKEKLCFHDCRIFAMAPEGNDLVMDIDYIFEWCTPKERGDCFSHPRHREYNAILDKLIKSK